MSRTLRLLSWVALWSTMLVGAASASCISKEEVRKSAAADFDGHVVQVLPQGATLVVDSVRRGAVQVGERVEVLDEARGMTFELIFSLGERYRVLPGGEERPYKLSGICSTVSLPGRVKVASEDDRGIGRLGAVGLVMVLGGIAVAAAILLKRRGQPMPS